MFEHPNPTRRQHIAALAICSLAGATAFVSCGFQPGHAPVTWSLADGTLVQLEDGGAQPAAASHLEGALGLLFGSPDAPRYLQTGTMLDDEVYPNDGGSAEVSDEVIEEILLNNRSRRFERQLELIEAGRVSELSKPLYAEDLWDVWKTDFAPLHSPAADEAHEDGAGSEDEAEQPAMVSLDSPHPEPYYATEDNPLWRGDAPAEVTWRDEAVALFTTWYPTMKESGEMYRQQCLHCHGAEGGGDGPTAAYLVPRPRDYRQGKFKRVSVDRNGRPTREDLYTILHEGIYGSAMPNFGRFSRGELEGLVDYVRLLSMRGENELMLANATVDSDNGDVPLDEIEGTYNLIWKRWNEAPDKVIELDGEVPRAEDITLERIEHGRELYNGTVANCYTCHGVDGRGNGESAWEEVAIVDADGNDTTELRRRLDEWGNDTLPRNFRLGEFRFGNRPMDLYRRIKVGISGTIMPAADPSLSDDDIWDLVYYVKTIASQYDIARVTEKQHAEIRARHAAEHADHGSGHGDDHGDGHADEDGHAPDSHDDDDDDHAGGNADHH